MRCADASVRSSGTSLPCLGKGLIKSPAFPQRLKPRCYCDTYGGTEVPPLQSQNLFRRSLEQIPFGNDNKKKYAGGIEASPIPRSARDATTGDSRFPSGMTTRKSTPAESKPALFRDQRATPQPATAGSLREWQQEKVRRRNRSRPYLRTRRRNRRRRFPSGMTTRKSTPAESKPALFRDQRATPQPSNRFRLQE